MDQELLPLLNELCHLAISRNAINTRRHRARFRKNYYAHALRVVEAHNESNYETRQIDYKVNRYYPPSGSMTLNDKRIISKLKKQKKDILLSMKHLRARHPKPTKWQSMGLHKLRSLILQGEGEYALAKHQTMEFTMKHRSRVQYLVSMLNCQLCYDNGALNAIRFKTKDGSLDFFSLEEIHHHAEQYELNVAVESMVEE